MKRATAMMLAMVALAASREASAETLVEVVDSTRNTLYIAAGRAEGLQPDMRWTTRWNERTLELRAVAVATHSAVLELQSPTIPVGSFIALPDVLVPPPPAQEVRPAPTASGPWNPAAAEPALAAVNKRASKSQPSKSDRELRIEGELSFALLAAADLANSSKSQQDIALMSQLSVQGGSWRYDHLISARLAASPDIFFAPLQHASPSLDIYLMRAAWVPDGSRFAASLGRQPAAPIGELGMVDGGRARVSLVPSLDATVFAGLRPAADLNLAAAPRAGGSLGWQYTGNWRARADAGIAVDAWQGTLDRAQSALRVDLAKKDTIVSADLVVDLASDAKQRSGPSLSHISARGRTRVGELRVAGSAGFERPFLSMSLFDELPGLELAARGYGDLSIDLPFGARWRARGTGRFTGWSAGHSSYAEAGLENYDAEKDRRFEAAPFAVLGDSVDEVGVRGNVALPFYGWRVGTGGSAEHVDANGETGWLGIARATGSRPFGERWRLSLALEGAAGVGPPRALFFALVGYRLGP